MPESANTKPHRQECLCHRLSMPTLYNLDVAPRRFRLFTLTLLLNASAYAEIQFNRDIRPIMAETCFRCHGPDKNARMAGMRLDIRDEALKATKSGVTPIVPGDPEHSAIVQS